MLFAVPPLTGADHRVLDGLAALGGAGPPPEGAWWTFVRRDLLARQLRASCAIEGYPVAQHDAVAAVTGDDPLDARPRAWSAIRDLRTAAGFVEQLVEAPELEHHHMLLNALHYQLLRHRPEKSPGRFRTGAVWITDGSTGEVIYRAPDAALVTPLMRDVTAWLRHGDPDAPPLARAAMAHLNLVTVHPWRDGNGRTTRLLHALLAARGSGRPQELVAIDEWLEPCRLEYYEALGAARAPSGASAWLRFCLRAHHMQMQRVRQRLDHAARLWEKLEAIDVPSRTISALYTAASGGRVRRTSYQRDEEISQDQATRDLRMLLDRGFLEQRGQTRGRYYVGAPSILAVSEGLGRPAPLRDPYAG